MSVGARDSVDLAGCADATLSAAQPLVAFETLRDDGVETQRLIAVDASCPSFAVEAPLFGCKGGTATVAMPHAAGSTYSWSVEGASVLSGLGTNRLLLTLGDGPAVRVSATVTGACTAVAEGVIAVRDPPGVMYQWGITGGGTILSGQGTSELTYVQNALPGGEISVTASYSDGLCSSTTRIEPYVARPGKVLEFSVKPATIKRGGTARVKHVKDRFIESLCPSPSIRANGSRLSVFLTRSVWATRAGSTTRTRTARRPAGGSASWPCPAVPAWPPSKTSRT